MGIFQTKAACREGPQPANSRRSTQSVSSQNGKLWNAFFGKPRAI